MVAVRAAPRQRICRVVFLEPPWHDGHPDFLRIDSDLPKDHPARRLAWAVARLDKGPLRRAYAGRGSPALPPGPLLAFVLFMCSRGLLRPAEWARQALYDDPSKWLLRGLRPSRSSLYSFRNLLGPFIDAWHKQLVHLAVSQRLTSASRGSLDGTFVASLASRHRLKGPAALDEHLLLLRLLVWIDRFCQEGPKEPPPDVPLPVAVLFLLPSLWAFCRGPSLPDAVKLPSWLPKSVKGRERLLHRYVLARQRLQARLHRCLDSRGRLTKKGARALKGIKVSLTDAEAALGWDKEGTYRPLYDVLLVRACDFPLILSWQVFSRTNDQGLLRPMLERTRQQLGLQLKEVLADGAFAGISDLLWCEKEKIEVYAPLKKETPRSDKGLYGKEKFRYDKEQGAYYCPRGQRLEAVSSYREKRQGGVELTVIKHRADAATCQKCPDRKSCTRSKKGRVVTRYEGEEVMERLGQRMEKARSKEIYASRGRTVELANADLKEHRGLRKFRGFGLELARTQTGLVVLAANALNVCRALHGPDKPPPLC
jgi:transposase